MNCASTQLAGCAPFPFSIRKKTSFMNRDPIMRHCQCLILSGFEVKDSMKHNKHTLWMLVYNLAVVGMTGRLVLCMNVITSLCVLL